MDLPTRKEKKADFKRTVLEFLEYEEVTKDTELSIPEGDSQVIVGKETAQEKVLGGIAPVFNSNGELEYFNAVWKKDSTDSGENLTPYRLNETSEELELSKESTVSVRVVDGMGRGIEYPMFRDTGGGEKIGKESAGTTKLVNTNRDLVYNKGGVSLIERKDSKPSKDTTEQPEEDMAKQVTIDEAIQASKDKDIQPSKDTTSLEYFGQSSDIVKVLSGYIDFTHLGNCYLRTARLVLYKFRELAEDAGISKMECNKIIRQILDQIEKE